MTKILIVDDNYQNLYLLEALLKGNGYDVASANNGKEALDLISTYQPDLIISDILMPVMDGYELCRNVKGDTDLRRIPFIFYTATYTDEKDEKFALSLGAERFVIKPQKPDVLLSIVREVLSEVEATGAAGTISKSEQEIAREYGEVLFRKLEKKVSELEKEINKRKKAEESLLQTAMNYSSLYNGMLDLFIKFDMNRSIIEFNFAYKEMLGYTEAELYALKYTDVIPEKWRAAESIIVENQVMKRGYSDLFEQEFIRKDGSVFPVELRMYLSRDGSGSPGAIWAVVRDITERKKAEEALRESERKYRIVADNTCDWEFWIDLNFNFIYCSPSCVNVSGYEASEFFADPHLLERMIHPDDRERMIAEMINERNDLALYIHNSIFKIIHSDGSVRWIGQISRKIFDDSGECLGIRGSNRDITRRVLAEEELRLSEERFSKSFKSSPTPSLLIDKSSRCILDVNDRLLGLFEFSRDELIGKMTNDLDTVVDPEVRAHIAEIILTEGKIAEYPLKAKTRSGNRLDVLVSVETIGMRDCEVFLLQIYDVTERKRIERELKKREEKIVLLLNSTAEAIYGLDINGNCTFCNSACLRMLNYKNENELLGRNMHDLIHGKHADGSRYDIEDCPIHKAITKEGLTHADNEVYWKSDGTSFPVEYWSYPMSGNGNESGSVVTFLDITERKRAEEEITFRNVVLRSQQEASIDGILIVDENKKIISLNRRYLEIWRLPNEMTGRGYEEQIFKNVKAAVADPDNYVSRVYYLYDHKADVSRDEILLKDGRILDRYTSPMIGDDGTYYGRVWYFRDITESKNAQTELFLYKNHLEDMVRVRTAELNESENKLKQAKEAAETANKAKTAFLSSMSHEIRTPLNAILGFSQLMQRDVSLSERDRDRVNTILRSGEHLLNLINDILEISRIESGRVSVNLDLFDLREFLDDVVRIFRYRVGEKELKLEMIVDETVPRFIEIDGNKLRQIFINLIGNSVKFTDEGGITVRVQSEKRSGDTCRLIAEVEDTGPGISPADMPKLFSTFEQTTLNLRKGGSGLGLSISRQFARLMGGNLTVRSDPGKGSCFHFEIDFTEKKGVRRESNGSEEKVIGLEEGQKKYRILVIDDDSANRELLVELLGDAGFELSDASTGEEAVEKFRKDTPDLVFMDMRLSDMDGPVLLKRLKSEMDAHNVPVVAVTASAFVENKMEIMESGVDGYICKPYKLRDIFNILKSLLGVRFIYAAEAAKKGEAYVQPCADKFGSLPKALTDEMILSARKLDHDRLLELIKTVMNTDNEIGEYLNKLATGYQYDLLIKTLAGGNNNGNK